MKEQLRILAGAHPMSPQGFERVQGLRRVVYDSADYREGMRAFQEKRPPVFGASERLRQAAEGGRARGGRDPAALVRVSPERANARRCGRRRQEGVGRNRVTVSPAVKSPCRRAARLWGSGLGVE